MKSSKIGRDGRIRTGDSLTPRRIFGAILNSSLERASIVSSLHIWGSVRLRLRTLCLRMDSSLRSYGPFDTDGFNSCVSNVRLPTV